MPVLSPFESELMDASVTLTSTLIERLVQHQGVEKVCMVQSPQLLWCVTSVVMITAQIWQILWSCISVKLSKLLVSCPACMCLPARNSLANEVEFLGLISKSGKDQ